MKKNDVYAYVNAEQAAKNRFKRRGTIYLCWSEFVKLRPVPAEPLDPPTMAGAIAHEFGHLSFGFRDPTRYGCAEARAGAGQLFNPESYRCFVEASALPLGAPVPLWERAGDD